MVTTFWLLCSINFHYFFSWLFLDLFMTFSQFVYDLSQIISNLFMTFSKLVHYLLMTCSLIVHCSQPVHCFFMTPSWVVTCSWLIHKLSMNCSFSFYNVSMTFLQFVHNLFINCLLLPTYSQIVHKLFIMCTSLNYRALELLHFIYLVCFIWLVNLQLTLFTRATSLELMQLDYFTWTYAIRLLHLNLCN